MTTIVTKYGNGVPTSSDLETGELGIDLTGQVIYTKDGGGQIIKLADGGSSATVDWGDILNKPDFDATYAPIDHTHDMDDVDGLNDKVTEIEGDIADLEDELAALATSLAFGGSFTAVNGTIVTGAKEGINDGAAIPDASTHGLLLAAVQNPRQEGAGGQDHPRGVQDRVIPELNAADSPIRGANAGHLGLDLAARCPPARGSSRGAPQAAEARACPRVSSPPSLTSPSFTREQQPATCLGTAVCVWPLHTGCLFGDR